MSKLRNNVAYQSVYQVLAVCVPLITSPYLSRVLGAEGLGIYSYNYSIVSYFMLLAMMGINTYGMRSIAQCSNDKKELSKTFFGIYYFQLICSGASIVLYLLFVTFFIKDEVDRTVSYIHTLYLVAEFININWLFFGLERYKETVLRSIFIKILTVIGIFVFVREKSDVIIYVLILAMCNVLSNGILWFKSKNSIEKVKITWQDIKKHIKPTVLLFIPSLAASVYHAMDKTMLGIFSDNFNSGYYYNADKLLNIPLTVITGCSGVFLTRVSCLMIEKKTEEIEKIQYESIYLGMCIISAIAFGVSAVASEFVPWFFGAGYEPCIELIKYFAVIVICKTISTHTRSTFLIPERNDKSYAKAITFGAVINLVANYILMALLKLGALGATLGTLIAEFAVAVVQIMFMKSKESRKTCMDGIIKSTIYLVMGAGMYVIVQMIPLNIASIAVKLVTKISIGAVVYLAECMMLWKIKPGFMPDMIGETLSKLKGTQKQKVTL